MFLAKKRILKDVSFLPILLQSENMSLFPGHFSDAHFFLVFVMSHTTLVLVGVSSYISGNISSPFSLQRTW